jgi:hypothetical protein
LSNEYRPGSSELDVLDCRELNGVDSKPCILRQA